MKLGAVSRLFFIIVLAVALALPPATTAQAATFIVTSSADSGAGSLRQAISDAAVGDTIIFAEDMTITLASQLVVGKPITITGAGHHITISGNHVTRVFLIPFDGDYSSGYPTFDRLTIADGSVNYVDCAGSEIGCGGGMMVEYLGGANITNSTFTGNTAQLAGGALYSYYGTVAVTNTTFGNNSTMAYGGAIFFFYGNMTLTNNTFYGNIVTNSGGYGSVFLNTWGTATLRNNLFIKGATNVNLCYSDISDGSVTIDGGGNVRWGDSSCPGTTANPLVGAPGDYGGSVPTLPLLPGSGALDAAADNCPASDARGLARSAPCDAGAYETGFTLTKTGGDGQSALVNTDFAYPLTVAVTPHHGGDPVDGGVVTLTAPSSGASLASTSIQAPISAGAATQFVTANGLHGGPYTVMASAAGANSAAFSLTNCLMALTVANNADSGAGSLREAVADVCAGGTISFASDLNGQTITLMSGPLAISKRLTITGPAAAPGLAISGNNASRVFDISAGPVTLSNLTIRDGVALPAKADNAGGAGLYIDHPGTAVTLNNCTLTANVSRAFVNESVTGLLGGAAAILPGASLTLNNSTVSGNNAGWGAGIYNLGMLAANNSTLTNNTSLYWGGGLYSLDSSAVTLRNTILAGNHVNDEPNDCFSTVAIQSVGYNLLGTTTNCPFYGASDSAGWSFATLGLGPLQNNGGPTPTHALLTDSPAIDFIPGCNGAPAADQRGIHRPQGASCDAGAFELVDGDAPDTAIEMHPDDPSPVTSAMFTFSGTDGAGSGVRGFECRLDGAAFNPCASGISYRDLTSGSHTFAVRATDRVGNVDTTPASFTWRVPYLRYLPLAAR